MNQNCSIKPVNDDDVNDLVTFNATSTIPNNVVEHSKLLPVSPDEDDKSHFVDQPTNKYNSLNENDKMIESIPNNKERCGIRDSCNNNSSHTKTLYNTHSFLMDRVSNDCSKTNHDSQYDVDPGFFLSPCEEITQSSISEESMSEFSSDCASLDCKETEGVDEEENSKELNLSGTEVQLIKHKQKISELNDIISRLKNEKDMWAAEASHEVCKAQIEQLRREVELFKQEHELDIRTLASMKLEIDSVKKQYDIANREREASVMRYATSEMEVINQRKEKENLDKKCKELVKEKDCISSKLKSVMIEKARINQLFDNKCSELANAQRDIEKLTEELNARDIKIKWTQSKLRSEIEMHKESDAQVDKLRNKILESEELVEKAKKDAEIAIKQFQCSQENRAYVLEQQLKEQHAQLILERHNLEDKENSSKQLLHEIDTLRNKHLLLIDENNALKLKVCSLEKEKQDHEQTISRVRESAEKSFQEVEQLHEKTLTMENLKLQLQQEREKVSSLQTEVSQLRASNDELLHDMSSCRERETEMLEFTQKVTAKNVRLQSEFSCIEAKARLLESEEEPLQRKVNELTNKIESLQKELSNERKDRNDEKKLVARHLAEKTAKVEALTKEVDDLKGENQVIKHKHSVALRELHREVAQCRRRLEQYEVSSGSDSMCLGSRASSCNSLNDAASTISNVTLNENIQPEPNKQTMIERILRLQRDNVRLREKVDFLEEHSKQLVSEMQKKTRVLQGYILREEAGALSSRAMDLNKAANLGWAKLKTRTEVAKHGGIMASVYGSKAVDDSMTLDLSLEINRKLQAVLEDTLLKNITLKENIDTLGDEIRRLSKKS
ncbi:coiled-coil domain-containing protein 186 [Macrosteles quadrilineatus]|uniref:coiled-coil domain-containing protein 186 n=1 Tax=Macrosteles quadrilineatus TaxID=74068 RepID=UPI0023E2DA59|nr:coiled-coil domain-containing protein 186 [Macrosteles quadrilineatus]